MKKQIVLAMLSLAALNVAAQDVVVKKDGSTILAKVLEVNQDNIKYKKFSNQNGPTYTINLSDVMSVNYENGEKEDFNNSSITNNANQGNEAKEIIKDAAPNNSELLNLYAKDYHLNPSYKLKDKETSFGIAFLSFSNSSILSNDEIEIYLERDQTQHPDNTMFGTFNANLKSSPLFRYDIVFKNKTSKIIYVDLANCFRTTNLGVSYCYYSSDIVTENKQSTSGGSFNLGGITNAAGIGGVAGSLANATTVGKSNSTSLSKTHINQRILQIPPKGKVCLSKFEYVTEKKATSLSFGIYEFINQGEEFFFSEPMIRDRDIANSLKLDCKTLPLNLGSVKMGEERKFTIENTPYTANYHLVYSTKEDFSTYSVLSPTLYINKIIGLKNQLTLREWCNEDNLKEIIQYFGEYTIAGPIILKKTK